MVVLQSRPTHILYQFAKLGDDRPIPIFVLFLNY